MKKNLLILLALVMLFTDSVFAQSRKITGKVVGADDGLPLPGVTVKVTGTSIGTQTNPQGFYTLNAPEGARSLTFSYIGFATKVVPITSATVNASLTSDTRALGEVVVVGYQSMRKGDVTGALATVDSTKFNEKTIPTFTQLLQGTAPGLQVTASSGRPGNNAVIRIRGVSSITAGNDPLIVVDGIQISSVAYNALNPDDIENVSILKDAAAVAIFGSRGSNGVILVTTKAGKPNQPSLRYSYRFGKTQRQPFENVELMNSAQKLQYEFDAKYTDPTLDSMITNRISSGALPAGSTLFNISQAQRQQLWDLASSRGAGDWSKYLFQNATEQKHELSLSGGADKITYYASGSYDNNPGVERYSEFVRRGGRLNVTYQVKPWFKLGSNIGVTQSHDNRVREAYNTQNSYGALFFFNPYEQPYLSDGSFNTTAQGFSPLEGAVNNPTTYDRVNDFGTFFGEAKFFKHLTLRSQYAVNYNTLHYQSYLQPGSNLANILGYNQKSDQYQTDYFYSLTNTANWLQTVGKHTFNALIGNEYDADSFYNITATARNFPSKQYTTLENAATPTTASTSVTKYALISYFGSLNYDFDKRFFINVSGRRDGSSRFGTNVRFANFGAVGAAWDLKNEKFFTLPNYVSELKLRGSYGTSGNENITDYLALGTYSLTGRYNDQTATIPAKLANPDLTWETNYQKDIGLTYGFFDSRITGELDWYSRDSKNLLYSVNVSQTTGFSSYTGNIGSVRNSGIEVGINGAVIRNKDLKWNVGFNYTHNRNKVTSLYSDNATGVNANGIARLKVGEPINVFNLVVDKGVNPANGNEVYYNIDGTTTETFSGGQAQILHGKSAIPTYYGSLNTNLQYKGFDFSAQLYYTGGNYIYNLIEMDEVSSSDVVVNLFTEANNYWRKPGDVVPFPRVLNPATGQPDAVQQAENYSTKFLEKGDYIELRDVTLGYTIPSKYTKKIGVSSIRVFANGQNLAIWTKFHGNPEVAEAGETAAFPGSITVYGYPPIRGYSFGVDVRF